jgi:hypothetical protein
VQLGPAFGQGPGALLPVLNLGLGETVQGLSDASGQADPRADAQIVGKRAGCVAHRYSSAGPPVTSFEITG